MSLEDLAAMDAEIATLRTEIANAKATEKLLRTSLISVNATLSTDELRTAVTILEHDKKEITNRLGPLRAGNVKPVLLEEKARVDGEWTAWGRRANSRKKIGLELWGVCTEEVEEGKTREDVWVWTFHGLFGQDANLNAPRRNGVSKAMIKFSWMIENLTGLLD